MSTALSIPYLDPAHAIRALIQQSIETFASRAAQAAMMPFVAPLVAECVQLLRAKDLDDFNAVLGRAARRNRLRSYPLFGVLYAKSKLWPSRTTPDEMRSAVRALHSWWMEQAERTSADEEAVAVFSSAFYSSARSVIRLSAEPELLADVPFTPETLALVLTEAQVFWTAFVAILAFGKGVPKIRADVVAQLVERHARTSDRLSRYVAGQLPPSGAHSRSRHDHPPHAA